MATPPKLQISEAALRESILDRIRWIFDPVDLDHILQIDKGLAKEVLAQRLDAHSAITRAISESSAKTAKLLR
ncbi:hypothetical protein [uncultured Rhodoblastus sp.]|uniref:hypothetical protein n=1 Tax=uncultured Rhodoblastus sp. TaxID=543037 RepID=UPI0025F0E1C9|nr:hypothetical protein [uncultured Rhodoblastus sp.]